jgi:hypothetical protein
MSPPLIDDRAAADLARIEREAAALLPDALALLPAGGGRREQKGRAALHRATARVRSIYFGA